MGVSTDGEISYGILFPEGFSTPWGYEGQEIEEWWRVVNGYIPPIKIFDETGGYINSIRPSAETIKEYFGARNAFDEAHPCPFEMVNVCSSNNPIYILALKGLGFVAPRGKPKAFDPKRLIVTDEQRATLIDFCKTYDIDIEGKEPAWYLSSYWG